MHMLAASQCTKQGNLCVHSVFQMPNIQVVLKTSHGLAHRPTLGKLIRVVNPFNQ